MKKPFLDRLSDGPLLCDGAYYLELERRCLGSYRSGIAMAVLENPEGVYELHREFAAAGAEILQAMAWGVHDNITREAQLHQKAVELARQAAGEDLYVAGTLSPFVYFGTVTYDPVTRQSIPGKKGLLPLNDDQKKLTENFFRRRVKQQIEAGVDLFILETFYSVQEVEIAIPFVKEAGVPAVVCMTYTDQEKTRDGLSPAEAAKRLAASGADVVGVNCHRPWPTMSAIGRAIRKAVQIPVCTQPNFYQLESGEQYTRALSIFELWAQVEPRTVTRFDAAQYAREAKAIGVDIIGSCCGSLPYHVRAMAETLGKKTTMPDIVRDYHVPVNS
jgi:betaine-homocysteine S-methyltransferase